MIQGYKRGTRIRVHCTRDVKQRTVFLQLKVVSLIHFILLRSENNGP